MEELNHILTQATEKFPIIANAIMTISAAVLILFLGWVVARIIRGRVARFKIPGRDIDPTLRPVLASVAFYIIMAMTLYAFLIKLGIPPASLLAVFGAAGLAIGLALRDTLSNIAAGVMMLVLRPLAVDDFVDISSAIGTVVEIGLFSTTIKTADGVYIYIPNGQVWTNRIQNFGRHKIRKALIDIGVSYDTDLNACKTLLLETLRNSEGALDMPTPPEVYVMSFGDSSINLSCRVWLPGNDWLLRTSNLRVEIKSALDKAKIEIPFPQRVITNSKKP